MPNGLHTAGDAGGEDLERGAGNGLAGGVDDVQGAGAGGVHVGEHDAGDDDGKDADEGLENHRAVADLDGVALVRDLLRGGAGGHQGVEAGQGAAGDGDEEHREHHAALGGEAGEGRGGDGGLALEAQDEDAEDGADDHDDHHDGGEVVARLLQGLDRHGAGEDQVHHDDGDPLVEVEVERELHAHGEHHDDGNHSHAELGGAGEVELALGPAEGDGNESEQNRDGAGAASSVGLGDVDGAVSGGGELEGAADHRGEGGDDNDAEQPGEQQEQATAGLADVLLDELGKRLAVVLHRGVEGAEVVDGAEEDAADEDPQHDGDPAEGHGHDGARHRAGAADRGELVGEHGEGGGGGEVLAILHAASGGEGLGVDAPLVGEPPAVEQVTADQHGRGNEHQYDSVHSLLSFLFGISNQKGRLAYTKRPHTSLIAKPPIIFRVGS